MHVAGRMVARDVQGLEVIVIDFNLRAFGNAESERSEDIFNLVEDSGNGMDRAERARPARKRNVEPFRLEPLGLLGGSGCRTDASLSHSQDCP